MLPVQLCWSTVLWALLALVVLYAVYQQASLLIWVSAGSHTRTE